MNERIKELADQAWKYADDNSRDGDETHGWLYRDKFAELIVREFLGFFPGNCYDDEYMRERIKEHFGVKDEV